MAHPEPHTRPRMSRHDRAAQFSPFAALTGHGEAMEETARLTDQKIEPGEIQLAELNDNLYYIQSHLSEKPAATITYFIPDARKDGGEYRTVTGRVRHIAEAEQFVELTDGTRIPIGDMLSLQAEKP
ncbi:MAG: hypothetical protein IJT44_07245 [Clostridia bacterium]|nr:hypothetical protein [Clostridia bacterium]